LGSRFRPPGGSRLAALQSNVVQFDDTAFPAGDRMSSENERGKFYKTDRFALR
jgi:hypothetical protein